ncbi:hypothetical protein [Thiothrix nivea]|uniref:hypothetical protein n=1 Tax=Thiothrix nivea TaxID=1031 RepID=UPI0002EAF4F3|nr:hypothetical protein [Thiothrix nivea]
MQRIINGGGRINREYGLGRKRTDPYIEWPVDEAHLLIFNRRPETAWDARIWQRVEAFGARQIGVWGA